MYFAEFILTHLVHLNMFSIRVASNDFTNILVHKMPENKKCVQFSWKKFSLIACLFDQSYLNMCTKFKGISIYVVVAETWTLSGRQLWHCSFVAEGVLTLEINAL